jgi:hypothetical protein
VGRFACIAEVTNTSRNLGAYAARPGTYRVRLTVGEAVRTQDFQILMDPRLDGIAADPVAEYAALDRLSASLFAGAQEMEAGVLLLRRVREQMDLRLEEGAEMGADAVVDGGTSLNERMEEWESRILQRYLETSQNNYMFEARLLVKFKDLLGRMSGANIPVTAGVREVTGDYLDEWAGHRTDLETLIEDLRAFNVVLRQAGLPELFLGAPRPIT